MEKLQTIQGQSGVRETIKTENNETLNLETSTDMHCGHTWNFIWRDKRI